MRLYESPLNHDEMINDAYPSTRNEEAGAMVFEARYIEQKTDEYDANSGSYQVVDIVEHFNLQPYGLTRAAFAGWAKQFMPMRKRQLEATSPHLVERFMADAKKFVTYIAAHFTEFEFFTGANGDPDDYLMCSTQEGDKTVFYFLELACDNSKC